MKKILLYVFIAMSAVNTVSAATGFASLRMPVEMRTTMNGDEKASAAKGLVEPVKNFSPMAMKHDQIKMNARRGPVGFVISAASLVVLVLILLILL